MDGDIVLLIAGLWVAWPRQSSVLDLLDRFGHDSRGNELNARGV
jgi:hypothetical protein